jgi:hypothetical protein
MPHGPTNRQATRSGQGACLTADDRRARPLRTVHRRLLSPRGPDAPHLPLVASGIRPPRSTGHDRRCGPGPEPLNRVGPPRRLRAAAGRSGCPRAGSRAVPDRDRAARRPDGPGHPRLRSADARRGPLRAGGPPMLSLPPSVRILLAREPSREHPRPWASPSGSGSVAWPTAGSSRSGAVAACWYEAPPPLVWRGERETGRHRRRARRRLLGDPSGMHTAPTKGAGTRPWSSRAERPVRKRPPPSDGRGRGPPTGGRSRGSWGSRSACRPGRPGGCGGHCRRGSCLRGWPRD